jgi:hypothetical protein
VRDYLAAVTDALNTVPDEYFQQAEEEEEEEKEEACCRNVREYMKTVTTALVSGTIPEEYFQQAEEEEQEEEEEEEEVSQEVSHISDGMLRLLTALKAKKKE